jgi:hypothetical protein
MRIIFLEFREISKVIILQFQALISISLNEKKVFFESFVFSSISKRGNFFSRNVFDIIDFNSFSKNHFVPKFIHKKGICKCENSFIADSKLQSHQKTNIVFSFKDLSKSKYNSLST